MSQPAARSPGIGGKGLSEAGDPPSASKVGGVEGLESGETGAGSPPEMRQATEAATEAAALRREWTSAEASPYYPQARPRTGPKAARAPETAVAVVFLFCVSSPVPSFFAHGFRFECNIWRGQSSSPTAATPSSSFGVG
eukprot:scaffold8214_cov121-Isochrysis_galbana.AAC.24